MGIDKCFFDDDKHTLFVCNKCGDVAKEPIVTTCCEDCFCLSCFAATLLEEDGSECGSCHEKWPETKTKKLQRQLGLIYYNLRMKCDEPTCSEVLKIENFEGHIKRCPNKPFDCKKCGMEGKLPDKDTHDCLEWLKGEKERLTVENKTLKFEVKTLKNNEQDIEIELDSLKTKLRLAEARSRNRQRSASRNRNGVCDGGCQIKLQEAQDQVRTINRRLNESYAQRDFLEKQLREATADNGGYSNDYGRITPASNGSGDGPTAAPGKLNDIFGVTSTKIVFDKFKTNATEIVMDTLLEAINLAESKNKVGRQKYDFVNRGLQKKLGGQWISLDAEEFNPAKANIAANTFCLYIYEGTEHVTFQRRAF